MFVTGVLTWSWYVTNNWHHREELPSQGIIYYAAYSRLLQLTGQSCNALFLHNCIRHLQTKPPSHSATSSSLVCKITTFATIVRIAHEHRSETAASMPASSPFSPVTSTFYNDMTTTHTTPPTAPPTAPSIRPPQAQSASFAEQEKRISGLESKLDSLLFVLSAQSHRLTSLTAKFDKLCELTDIEIPDDKPVETRMKDYEMKFTKAKENANEAVLERRRTISNAGKDGAPAIVGLMQERKRTMSITRSCRDVKLAFHIWVLLDSVDIINETVEVKATEYDEFSDVMNYANARLEERWDDSWDETEGMELDASKWRMTLNEEGYVADLTRSPMRLTNDDEMAEEMYKGWYHRNVLKGTQMLYEVTFRVDMKSSVSGR